MNEIFDCTVASLNTSDFTLLFEHERIPDKNQANAGMTIRIHGDVIKLPQLNIVESKKTAAELWMVKFSCPDSSQLSKCYWVLKFFQKTPDIKLTPNNLPRRHLYLWNEDEKDKRINFLRNHTGSRLQNVVKTKFRAEELEKNLEGFFGSVEIPVGIAGPLLIKGMHARGTFYAPMATTEGALVASISRGAYAISKSGGVTTRVLKQRMMRVPRFQFDSALDCISFCEWASAFLTELQAIVHSHSRFAQLINLEPKIIGNVVHLAFIYETGDAAGQNMTTTCTWHACQWLQKNLPSPLKLRHFLIESNFSSDKKASGFSFFKGRGTEVTAEVRLSPHTCKGILKVAPRQLVDAFNALSEGAVAAGMLGMNINTANVIAAMFTAFGQDIACTHESSLSHLRLRLEPNDIVYCSITLPSLVVGTVGGGTNLPDQAECLALIGCYGSGNGYKLAEIIASFCLALDLSTLSALANDEFAKSHELLGRKRSLAIVKDKLVATFFPCFNNANFKPAWGDTSQTVAIRSISWEGAQDSILTAQCNNNKSELPTGMFAFSVQREEGNVFNVILKNKPSTFSIATLMKDLATACSETLGHQIYTLLPLLEFNNVREREIEIIQQSDPAFTKHTPILYGLYEREPHQIIIEELLENEILFNSVSSQKIWSPIHLYSAIAGIAEIHALWLCKEKELKEKFKYVIYQDATSVSLTSELWKDIADFSHQEHPDTFTYEMYKYWYSFSESSSHDWSEMESMPRTLIHNDFSPRNIALRKDSLHLCCWDWELATVHIPQRDLAELLCYTLSENVDNETLQIYIDFHRMQLELFTKTSIDKSLWYRGFCLALRDFGIRRLSFYLLLHHVSPQSWFVPVLKTWTRLVQLTHNVI